MRSWVWLLPCWVWRTLFLRAAKHWVQVDGHPRRAFRLDAEFMLIYDPEEAARAAAWGHADASVPTEIGVSAIRPDDSSKARSSIGFRDELRRDLSRTNTAAMLRAIGTSDREDGP